LQPEHAPQRKRRLSRDERRDRIVEAALRTFSRCGYRGATTRELAQAARITEVTLFRYFPTKEKLFGAVIEKYSILPILRAELAGLSQGGDARATLRSLGRRFLEVLQERQDIIRVMVSESAGNPRQARMLFRQGPGRFLEDISKMLGIFSERGEIRRVDLKIASRGVLGLFFSFIQMQEIFFAKETDAIGLDRAANELSDLLWFGLCPQRPTAEKRKGEKRS
jgi:AcrR family transcriptional regulator